MEAATLEALLSQHPERSRWEYVNFVLEPYGEFQGRAILSQMRRLQELRNLLSQGTSTQHHLVYMDMAAEKQQIESWLASFSSEEIASELSRIEETDPQYWVQRLGREAAVDMISSGRISRSTLDRAILLDETNYRAFAETCNTILKVVGDVTRDVELSMGLHPQLPEGEPQ